MKKALTLLLAGLLAALALGCVPETATTPDAPVVISAEASAQPDGEAAPAADYTKLAILLSQVASEYQPGSAGCSLRAARLAGQLMDWNAQNAGDAEGISATVKTVYDTLPGETASQYASQLNDMYRTAIQLTEDGAEDLLSSAGYTPAAYPYARIEAETLFTALLNGIGAKLNTEEKPFMQKVDPTQPIQLDVDSDGIPEQVTILVDEEAYVTDITFTSDTVQYTDHVEMALSFLSAYVGGAWQCDASQSLLLTGDEASDDYMTLVYRMQGGQMQQAEIYGRLLDADANGLLTIERAIDVFGTYGGVCEYQMQDDFSFTLASPFRVQAFDDNPDGRKLTVICDSLPVTILDGSNQKSTLPKGTELMLRETDQESYAVLENASGAKYRVAIERHDDDWQWYIDGMPEDQCFTPLMYAG